MSKEKENKISGFFKKEYHKLVKFAESYSVYGSGEGEDAVQDVMLNIFDLADFTVSIEELSSYVYRSIKNRLIDMKKSRNSNNISLNNSKENTSLEELISDFREDITNEADKNELREILFQAIDSLTELDRDIVIMTEFESISFKELSELKSIPIGTLLSRKSRALEKIRKFILEEKGENYVSFSLKN